MVLLEFAVSAIPPIVVPLELTIPVKVAVPELPFTIQFLIVLLVAPFVADALAIQITMGVIPVLVFSIVMSFEAVPLFDPSKVIKSAPYKVNIDDPEPEIVVVTPAFGRIVTVFVAVGTLVLATLIMIGKVSVG